MPLKNVKKLKHYSPEDAHLAYRQAEQYLAGAIGSLLKLPVERNQIPYDMIQQLAKFAQLCKAQQPSPPMEGEGI